VVVSPLLGIFCALDTYIRETGSDLITFGGEYGAINHRKTSDSLATARGITT
jgi:hypothetical protein